MLDHTEYVNTDRQIFGALADLLLPSMTLSTRYHYPLPFAGGFDRAEWPLNLHWYWRLHDVLPRACVQYIGSRFG